MLNKPTQFIQHNLALCVTAEKNTFCEAVKVRHLVSTARKMVNLTEGENVPEMKTLLSANIRVGLYIAIAAVNIVLSITAFLGNILILIALRKVTSIHPPTKLLFQCLAITDLGVGLTSQPVMVILMLTSIDIKIWNKMYYHLFSSLSFTFCGVSVFASTALSVDRLLALFLGLRYRHVVTLKRIRAVLACGCLASLLIVLVWNQFGGKTARIIITIYLTLCLIISLFSYTKIVLRLRQQGQGNTGGSPLNLERYKRTVVSVALVQLALVICYFPFTIFNTLIHLTDIHPSICFLLDFTSTTLLFLNSSLNPFLYCWRIKEVRQAVKATIRRFWACLSQGTSTLSRNQ